MLNTDIDLKILKARAEKLAKKQIDTSAGKHIAHMLFFRLENENYAINLEQVEDVLQVDKVTSIPCTPAYVIGVINLRGQIFSLLSLKTLFNVPNLSVQKKYNVLLLASSEMQFAVAVDDILGVSQLYLDDIQPSLTTLNGLRSDYVQGVTADMTIVLNARKMLADQRLIVHEDISD